MNLYKVFSWILDSRQSREMIASWCKKAGRDDADSVIEYVEGRYKSTKEQLAAARWLIQSGSDDYDKTQRALYICEQKKLDPLKENINDLISRFPDIKPKEKPLNPDNYLTDKQDEGNGVVTYAARLQDRAALRNIINTHYGKDANPWCLLQGDRGGELTSGSGRMWEHYSAYPKRVAFKDGKLLAFSAGTNESVREWWDRFDRSFPFIPYAGKTWEGQDGFTYSINGNGTVFKENEQAKGVLNEGYTTDFMDAGMDAWYDKKYNTLAVNDVFYDNVKIENGKYVATRTTYNGGVTMDTFNQDFKKDGLSVVIGPDGKLWNKCAYKNGEKNGPYESYYANGQLEIKCTYKDDELDGAYEKYYNNGQLLVKCTYKNDKLEGLRETYNYNGRLALKCTFKNGKEDGLYEEYYDNGQLEIKCTYKDGKKDGTCESYYDNGRLAFKGIYKDDERNGAFEKYFDDGKLRSKGTYKDGELNGPYERYWSNGQLWSKCTYKNDERDGLYAAYSKDGQLVKNCIYKDGEEVEDLMK